MPSRKRAIQPLEQPAAIVVEASNDGHLPTPHPSTITEERQSEVSNDSPLDSPVCSQYTLQRALPIDEQQPSNEAPRHDLPIATSSRRTKHLKTYSSKARVKTSTEHEWPIEKLLASRHTDKGREFKVEWRSTWVSEADLINAKAAVRAFDETQG
ncbi:MAG: hypothetical protein M1822_009940 [Bathelium mastoideum]|nr:MAG: hypothetical protein M1822_009940 [Bathelium mastoideum]